MIVPAGGVPGQGPGHDVVVAGLGTRLGLRLRGRHADALHAAVGEAWARCLVPPVGAGDGPALEVVLDPRDEVVAAARGRGATAATDLPTLLHHLSPAVTLRLLEARAGELVLLHACALAHPTTGRVAVLVAPSGTGKTTTTRTLGARWGYLSDETAGVDADGRVLAYPKPLSVIPAPGAALKEQVAPDALGLARPPVAPVVGALAVLERHPDGPEVPEVEEVPVVRALAELAGQTSSLARTPRPLHRLAAVVERAGGLRRVRYREAATLEPLLDAWCGEGAR
ncbi:hypothetical protein INN71_15985 [Nocardioides sp. ChNu-153]|uniref:hypothetical protein n=1 Tax=unclassified Nocardioides TaxID=2615069 RepID=UPI002404C63F|nr:MULTISPECIES: hypothetical protein [unclassified Nocardioides]MDF9716379.1 hypothetical protein [Nocardioides sp. ChNu-99]MDN7122885.1 hypothetical protein [Nocardioides sp. ChNu-153]